MSLPLVKPGRSSGERPIVKPGVHTGDRPIFSPSRAAAVPAEKQELPVQLNERKGDINTPERSAKVAIAAESDVASARKLGVEMSARAGFATGDQMVIAAAITEVARNIVAYAGSGEITLTNVSNVRPGIVVVAHDNGPGIPDVSSSLREGFSTSGGSGLGLSGARRLMDDFEIVSAPGKGTTVTMQKWRRTQS